MRALARPLPESRTLVLGGGAVGLLVALLARAYGCLDVTVAETNALRRASAAAAGDIRAYDPATGRTPPASSVDVVIDAVGGKSTRAAALEAVKPGGVVVHIGLMDWASEIDMRKLTLAEITLVGTYTYTMADLRATVQALQAGVYGALDTTTSYQLMELANPSQPLLRRLLLETPGTYHHSLMVGNLAERAAEMVGADPLLVRVAAY